MNALQTVPSLVHASQPLFALALTLGAYLLGVAVQRRTRSPLLNPVLIAIVLIGAILRLGRVPYETYFNNAQLIHFLLGPGTVALAIPFVEVIQQVRRNLWPLLAALLFGSVVAAVSGYGLVRLCGGSRQLALTMLPKALTTPIAIEVAKTVGGIPSLTAVFAILSGILVAITIDYAAAAFHITNEAAIGLAAGTAGSGIGASQVIPRHPLAAAFAAIAIAGNGIVTAALAPVLAALLSRW